MIEGAGEAVMSLLDVTLLPVALPKTHPGVRQAWVPFDGTSEKALGFRVVVSQHVEGLALQVAELLLR